MTPAVAKVEVKRHGKARRAKLYYLRKRTGREAITSKNNGVRDNLDRELWQS